MTGQEDGAPMVGLGLLLSVSDVASARENIFGEDKPVDPAARRRGRPRRRVLTEVDPLISASARGRDNLCLDLDPAPGGAIGQILEHIADADERPLVAKSFADLLSKYFAAGPDRRD